jgi:hypothetical protein
VATKDTLQQGVAIGTPAKRLSAAAIKVFTCKDMRSQIVDIAVSNVLVYWVSIAVS